MASAASQGSSAAYRADSLSPPLQEVRPHARRRIYFVKKWLQTRYIIYYLAIMLASSAALFLLIHRYARMVIRTELSQGHSVVFNTWSILGPEMVRVNLAVIGANGSRAASHGESGRNAKGARTASVLSPR